MTANPSQAAPALPYDRPSATTVAPDARPLVEPQTGLARRLAERFALIAFGLYHVPLFLNNYPSLGGGGFNTTGLAPRWGHIFTPPGVWVARHIFGITGPMPNAYNGDNGDVAEEFGRLLLCVVIGAVGAIAWTIADRRRPKGQWVESTVRVLLRYSIALGLMSYAVAKILPQQFPPIALGTLERRVGDLTPMSLLWTFMQYSRAYAFFGGVMELVAVILLCFRRTATLGALVCLAVMTNVAFLNYAYGVPVKLYATMITLSAAVLVLYDARRLFDVFMRNRPVGASRESTLLQDSMPRVRRRIIKVTAVGSVALSSVAAMAHTLEPTPQSLVEGLWNVTPSSVPAWRKMNVGPFGVMIQTVSDSAIGCGRARSDSPVLSLQCVGGHRGQLAWTRVQDTLRVQGTFDGAPVNVTATVVARSSFTLIRSRFRWIID